MSTLRWTLQQPSIERRRREMKISSPDTVLAVAAQLAASADFTTGRNVAVSCTTIAVELHLQPATVKRITRFLRRLGFLLNLVTGANRLTLDQIREAAYRGAPAQRSVAATRALVLPGSTGSRVDSAPLPVNTSLTHASHLQENSPSGTLTRAAQAGAPRRPQRRRKNTARSDVPVPLAAQQLAARLASSQHMPWLARDQHIGSLARGLHRYQLAERGWTAAQILHRIDTNTVLSAATLPLDKVRMPIAHLLWQIRQCISPSELAPARLSQLAAREATQRQRAEAEQAAERRARIAAERDQIDQIVAAMKTRPSRVTTAG